MTRTTRDHRRSAHAARHAAGSLRGGLISVALILAGAGSAGAAGGPPPIRAGETNAVPACVTPQRLMDFITSRNSRLEAKFEGVAEHYRTFGRQWRVRWDYAFFQMILETNYLQFRRGDGSRGDVHPRQNNFAGLGATGGGVPGDSYPDVATGVRAQIEHLVAYSGERVPEPIGPRTRLAQDGIVSQSLRLKRPVTFADLRNRWAADRNYARSIETVAERFREAHCTGKPELAAEVAAAPAPGASPGKAARPVARIEAAPAVTVAAAVAAARVKTAGLSDRAPATAPQPTCRILSVSYGGQKTLLIRAETGREVQYTLLTVLDGFEQSLSQTYMAQHAPGGTTIGSYPTQGAAMAKARELCVAS